jgi:hypothetical protein
VVVKERLDIQAVVVKPDSKAAEEHWDSQAVQA